MKKRTKFPEFKNVTRYTRASRRLGKVIFCPKCMHASRVFHFGWSDLECERCRKMIEKNDFLVLEDRK